jgi:hypothetical protein
MKRDERPPSPPPKPRRTAAETLTVMLDHMAFDEADDPEPTDDDRRWAKEQAAAMQTRIAGMRRQRLQRHPAIGPAALTLSAELLAMTRGELVARLVSVSQGGAVQYSYRKLTGLTDDDLRYTLAALVSRSEE